MSRVSLWLRGLKAAGSALLVVVPLALPAMAEEESLIAPDWNAAEVKEFIENRAATRSVGTTATDGRDQVKLPVLMMKEAPEAVTRSLGAAPAADTPPVFVYDENNPVWYQVTHTYGDITVTIEADLRVKQKLGPEAEVVETNPTRGLAPTGEDVAVYDDAEEEGAPGYVAEYTIEKFGVPYTIRVECTAAVKAECADKAKVAETQALLTIAGGNPDGKE